ncbi:hypothetical protein NBE99_09380 [Thermosynechococcus sp. HN-54]|uniref:hypothetical protein n=1 Tax=Thermosynechococcus sp. HN-54 TaxID=2933959 RepID=UPI00202CC7FE|nr:hypothetical protein [Thermosynechococcus sp. HN-54]URR34850.1 hypothetical protein NBE99_09380 [Thermosynechococcus sp. HN-54]
MGIVLTHWSEIGSLNSQQVIPAVEGLVHAIRQNPNPKYPSDRTFHKFPSYYRRDAQPPTLNGETGYYPTLYRGQCYRLHGYDQVELKVFTGKDWVWTTVQISGRRERHTVDSNKQLSPSLICNGRKCHLAVPFECHPEKRQPDNNGFSGYLRRYCNLTPEQT